MIQRLAKDGIYLTTAPRSIMSIPLAPGNRADVAILCSGTGTATLSSVSTTYAKTNEAYTGVVMTLTVSGAAGSAGALTPFSVYRPCYLVSTLSSTPSITDTLAFGPGVQMNGAIFSSETTYLNTYGVGALVQLSLVGISDHVWHQHVNPFQISVLAATDPVYFQVRLVTIVQLKCLLNQRF